MPNNIPWCPYLMGYCRELACAQSTVKIYNFVKVIFLIAWKLMLHFDFLARDQVDPSSKTSDCYVTEYLKLSIQCWMNWPILPSLKVRIHQGLVFYREMPSVSKVGQLI